MYDDLLNVAESVWRKTAAVSCACKGWCGSGHGLGPSAPNSHRTPLACDKPADFDSDLHLCTECFNGMMVQKRKKELAPIVEQLEVSYTQQGKDLPSDEELNQMAETILQRREARGR